jgi:hypothetical protein
MGNDSNLGGKTLRVIINQNIAYRNYLKLIDVNLLID